MTDNSPQLGGQPSDNAPMISGRGTKIMVSARGAYEARSFRGLFAAMNTEQRMMFRQAFVGQVLGLIRPIFEQADEPDSPFAGFLSAFDDWLRDPSTYHCNQIRDWYSQSREYGNEYWLRGMRLRCLTIAVFTEDKDLPKLIYFATNALESDADWFALQEQYREVIVDELREWVIELGWAILHAREAPALRIDWPYIKTLLKDAEHWYHKGNLKLLVHRMTPHQQEQFTQAIRRQALGYIESVPASLWTDEQQQVIEQARQWVSNPATLSGVDVQMLLNRYGRRRMTNPPSGAIAALVGVFRHRSDASRLADTALTVARYVKWMHKPFMPTPVGLPPVRVFKDWEAVGTFMWIGRKLVPITLSLRPALISNQWQVEAAYAILTDQPIPPLGDPQ